MPPPPTKLKAGWLMRTLGLGQLECCRSRAKLSPPALLSTPCPPHLFSLRSKFRILSPFSKLRTPSDKTYNRSSLPCCDHQHVSPMCLKSALIYGMSCDYKSSCNHFHAAACSLGQSEPGSLAMAMPVWLRISDLLSPLRRGLCFMLTLASTS